MMNDDIGELFAWAFLLLVFLCGGFVIWLLWKLIEYIDDNPEEAGQAARFVFLVITSPVWLPPVALARLALFIVRDLPVYCWQLLARMGTNPSSMIINWVIVVPIVLSGYIALMMFLLMYSFPDFNGQVVGVIYFWLLHGTLIGYFYLYFFRPLKHHNWPVFIAAEENILFDIRSGLRLKWYNLRLWLLVPWRSLKYLNVGRKRGLDATSSG